MKQIGGFMVDVGSDELKVVVVQVSQRFCSLVIFRAYDDTAGVVPLMDAFFRRARASCVVGVFNPSHVPQAIHELALRLPSKHRSIMAFLSNALRLVLNKASFLP